MVASPSPRIRINGVFLDEVHTLIHHDHPAKVISFSSAPAHKHGIVADGDALVLRTPAVTALQLYHDKVLPGDPARGVDVEVGGEELGRFVVDSVRRPRDRGSRHDVHLWFVRVESRSTST